VSGETAESDGWVQLDAQRPWVRFLLRNPLNVFDLGLTDINPVAIALSIAFAIVAGIVWLLLLGVIVATTPRPMVHLVERKIRLGKKTLDFEQVNSARLYPSGGRKKREIELKFGKARGSQLYVHLVVKGNSVVDRSTRDILTAIFEGSSLETRSARAKGT
jgi:hypothetical protein